MESIPFFESYNPNTRQLTLRGADHFPEQILDYAEQIEILDLSSGSLSMLPPHFAALKNLKVAFFSQNHFTVVPEVLGECEKLLVMGFKSCRIKEIPKSALPRQLQWLILTDNNLRCLPHNFGELGKLRKLALAGNHLDDLPESMQECHALELIRLGANDFNTAPAPWIYELPSLAWYCDSGNPFSIPRRPKSLLSPIPLTDIEYHEQVGSSPTSTVFRGILKSIQHPVAIKHYRAELTSDGYAADDIATYLSIGDHPNLIKARGEVFSHAVYGGGLVLDLVPESYQQVGKPPSFSSCTRDTFPADSRFSLSFIQRVLVDVSCAVEHLHSKNISHGDIYAHNILADESGRSILGDFGAASHFNEAERYGRVAAEIRAFGHLIDDLLSCRRDVNADNPAVVANLKQLWRDCMAVNVGKNLTMTDIHHRLLT